MEQFLHKIYNFFLRGIKSVSVIVVFCLMGVMGKAQENVFHRSDAGTDNWWDSNNPWFYQTTNNNQNRPDNNNSSTTRHNIFIGHNNNTGMNINGAFFTLRSLNFQSTINTDRTFTDDNSTSGLAFTSGIFNESSGTHTFNARIAADNNIILRATNGPLIFNREIFTNGNVVEFSGLQNISVAGTISQAGSVYKDQTGVTTFTGACTYTGATTVNAGTLRLNRTNGATLPAANDILVNAGGTLQISSNQTIDNLTVNAGAVLLVDANTTLTISGTFTGGGTITNYGRIVLAGSAIQYFPGPKPSTSITAMNELEVNNASGVRLNNDLSITGSLILTTGTLNIEADNLLDLNGATLITTTGYLGGSSTSDLTVRGIHATVVSIPQNGNISLRNVTIGGTRTVAMNGINNLNLRGALTIGSTATFDNGGESQIFLFSGSSISIDGRFITRALAGFTNTGGAIPSAVISPTLNAGCIIEYGSLQPQVVNERPDYKNITLSGNGIKSLSGPCSPAGTVYITDNATFETGSYKFGDENTNLKMDGGKFRMGGTGTKPNIDGVFTLSGGVIEFYNMFATPQTIKGLNNISQPIEYKAIEITGSNVANSNSNITLGSGGIFTIKNGGNFAINADAIIGPSGSQTVTVESGGTFICGDVHGFSGGSGLTSTSIRSDIDNIILQTGSTVEYARTTPQVFTARTDYKNISISGGGEKTVNGPSTIAGTLTLNSGIITTTNTNLLTMSNTSSVTGASDISFVNGPVKKIGNTAFIFPVGKPLLAGPAGGGYRAIGISAPADNNEHEFTAEFYVQNATLLGSVVAPLVRVSACELWRLDKNNGNSTVNVTLSWNERSKCNVSSYVSNLATLVVAHHTGIVTSNNSGTWNTYGNDGYTGDNNSGTVTWNNVSSFSPFALGSMNQADNILPLTLSSFTARARKTDVQIDWNISNNNDQEEYILESSHDGVQFTAIKIIKAKVILNQAAYAELDQNPYNGWNYYRLRVINKLGREKLSQVVKVWFGFTEVIRISPNPASEKISINLANPSSINQIQLVNYTGQLLKQVNTIQYSNEINISELAAGMYYLRLAGKNGTIVRPFVKK